MGHRAGHGTNNIFGGGIDSERKAKQRQYKEELDEQRRVKEQLQRGQMPQQQHHQQPHQQQQQQRGVEEEGGIFAKLGERDLQKKKAKQERFQQQQQRQQQPQQQQQQIPQPQVTSPIEQPVLVQPQQQQQQQVAMQPSPYYNQTPQYYQQQGFIQQPPTPVYQMQPQQVMPTLPAGYPVNPQLIQPTMMPTPQLGMGQMPFVAPNPIEVPQQGVGYIPQPSHIPSEGFIPHNDITPPPVVNEAPSLLDDKRIQQEQYRQQLVQQQVTDREKHIENLQQERARMPSREKVLSTPTTNDIGRTDEDLKSEMRKKKMEYRAELEKQMNSKKTDTTSSNESQPALQSAPPINPNQRRNSEASSMSSTSTVKTWINGRLVIGTDNDKARKDKEAKLQWKHELDEQQRLKSERLKKEKEERLREDLLLEERIKRECGDDKKPSTIATEKTKRPQVEETPKIEPTAVPYGRQQHHHQQSGTTTASDPVEDSPTAPVASTPSHPTSVGYPGPVSPVYSTGNAQPRADDWNSQEHTLPVGVPPVHPLNPERVFSAPSSEVVFPTQSSPNTASDPPPWNPANATPQQQPPTTGIDVPSPVWTNGHHQVTDNNTHSDRDHGHQNYNGSFPNGGTATPSIISDTMRQQHATSPSALTDQGSLWNDSQQPAQKGYHPQQVYPQSTSPSPTVGHDDYSDQRVVDDQFGRLPTESCPHCGQDAATASKYCKWTGREHDFNKAPTPTVPESVITSARSPSPADTTTPQVIANRVISPPQQEAVVEEEDELRPPPSQFQFEREKDVSLVAETTFVYPSAEGGTDIPPIRSTPVTDLKQSAALSSSEHIATLHPPEDGVDVSTSEVDTSAREDGKKRKKRKKKDKRKQSAGSTNKTSANNNRNKWKHLSDDDEDTGTVIAEIGDEDTSVVLIPNLPDTILLQTKDSWSIELAAFQNRPETVNSRYAVTPRVATLSDDECPRVEAIRQRRSVEALEIRAATANITELMKKRNIQQQLMNGTANSASAEVWQGLRFGSVSQSGNTNPLSREPLSSMPLSSTQRKGRALSPIKGDRASPRRLSPPSRVLKDKVDVFGRPYSAPIRGTLPDVELTVGVNTTTSSSTRPKTLKEALSETQGGVRRSILDTTLAPLSRSCSLQSLSLRESKDLDAVLTRNMHRLAALEKKS